ncbi:phage tail sheath family protein [Ancylobacter terrae]|uniref:phage tail sheath family protein n=1 Tax=Ancylobacter sp. sgz301288 TaxID=3342077 RepID=UPI00385D155A
MPVYRAPGVYVEEIASEHWTIEPVPTSIAAFLGATAEGPTDTPVSLYNSGDFERAFGRLDPALPLPVAVARFFEQGGGQAVVVRVGGLDGAPDAAALIGDAAAGTGLHAFERVDTINLLLTPGISDPAVQAAALDYAERRRALLLIDLPENVETPAAALEWRAANPGLLRPEAAAWFPRLAVFDPRTGQVGPILGNTGAIAGIIARTDVQRGIWKAPAGTGADLSASLVPALAVDDDGNRKLNPAGINAIRRFPARGTLVWGGRTLSTDPEWKYIPVRRLHLHILESLARGLRRAALEPDGERLRARAREAADGFLDGLFRAGAFAGRTPREAWFVQTVDLPGSAGGGFDLLVGHAPVRPGEFLIAKLRVATAPA